ncbi:alpha/beta hydrolase [Nonlabens agnitus]|uniref:Alpha/beta hydrolase n=1 Tax=Nonlabens agnitus TaxID=870484 RepID=A0A2S9WX66_9FLAO|nr:alpha/beta hydrolase [Nonlabens agnitus]PRP68067.1 alpha/beta hydrolase [Nonlabens agnitus]
MRYLTSTFLFCSLISSSFMIAQSFEIDLWETNIPNAINNPNYQESPIIEGKELMKTSQVTAPTLTIFKPENPNGTAILILPGGGYKHLAIHKEGTKIARWLNTLVITGIVLKYRLPSDVIMDEKSIGPLQDAQKAMRVIRSNAATWGIDPAKIGVMGFSAGGHLAATLSTGYDDEVYIENSYVSAKPNFSMLIYPVITMHDEFTHQGSKSNLLGDNPTADQIEMYSTENRINQQTPPTILIHALDDTSVPYQNSVIYFEGLQKHDIASEIHLYQKGGHGFGLNEDGPARNWPAACEQWLRTNALLRKGFP